MPEHTKNVRTYTFHHAELGKMTGVIAPDGVVQFRAIPFATIPARFKQSVLQSDVSEAKGDFTRIGYACPQAFRYERTSSGGLVPGETWPPPTDELKCLIIQLSIPITCLETVATSQRLPVMVYIHGGGFVLGHIDEQHNTAFMVEQSLVDSRPVIMAAIQYRLGALGYLHTPEAGHTNLALNDQRTALRWIQKFIGGFGGDPQKVTAMGESAGAISICSHMLSPPPTEGPLFQRAVLMSGTLNPMTMPISIGEAENTYESLLNALGITEQGEVGLEKLRHVPLQKLIEAAEDWNSSGGTWLTVKDDQFFGSNSRSLTWDRVPELLSNCDWVGEIMLGTTGFEGAMVMSRIASIQPKAFLDGIAHQLGSEAAALTGRTYGITSDMDQNLFQTRAMQWMGDLGFEAPSHELLKYLTRHTNKKIYRYVFDVRNPFPNSVYYQTAHHWVDMYFLFKTLQFRYPTQRLKNISTRHAQLWNSFTNGNAPWSEYKYTDGKQEVIMVADEREEWVERKVADHERLAEWSWERCEALWKSWESQKGKDFKPMGIEPFKGMPKT